MKSLKKKKITTIIVDSFKMYFYILKYLLIVSL